MKYYLYLIVFLFAYPIQYLMGIDDTLPWLYFPLASLSMVLLFNFNLDKNYNRVDLFLTISLGILFLINTSIFAPNGLFFLMVWIPVFIIYPNSKLNNKELIKLLSFYQIAIDFFVITGLVLFLIPIIFNTIPLMFWCKTALTRNCSLLTEPNIASIFALSGLFPNLVIKRDFLSLKTSSIEIEKNISLLRFLVYIIFIFSTSSVAGLLVLITFFYIYIFNDEKRQFNLITKFYNSLNIKLNIKKIGLLITTILGFSTVLIFRSQRVITFFTEDFIGIFQLILLNSDQYYVDAGRTAIVFSSELRILGPFIAFYEALKNPFGYDPMTVFDESTFLPIRYFSIGPNSLEIVITYTGYLGIVIFLYLIFKQLKFTNLLFLYIVILSTDGSINKPYLGFYLIILSIVSSLKINKINKLNGSRFIQK